MKLPDTPVPIEVTCLCRVAGIIEVALENTICGGWYMGHRYDATYGEETFWHRGYKVSVLDWEELK